MMLIGYVLVLVERLMMLVTETIFEILSFWVCLPGSEAAYC
jgi:hypothetical protein